MTRLSRDILSRAFPNEPRLIGELEELDRFLSDAEERVTTLLASAEEAKARLTALEDPENQHPLLAGITELDDQIGAIEILGPDSVTVRGIDAADAASLLSRGQGDVRYMLYAGKDTSANRPTLTANQRAIYLDTTLAANGKPIFWTGTTWVDSTGAAV